MATFFGEVTYNPSRACDDDEDDEFCQIIDGFETAIRYNDTQSSSSEASSLIVSFGLLANEFLEKLIGNVEVTNTGKIHFVKLSDSQPEDTIDFHPKKLRPSKFFESKNGAVLCQSSQDTIPSVAHSLAKRILSLVDLSCPVLIFCSYHYSKLNHDSKSEEIEKCVTYTLQTSSQFKTPFPPLPQPSTLDSLPAAIMTQCLLENRPCIIYSAFSETSLTGDSDLVADPFITALSLPPFVKSLNICGKKLKGNRGKISNSEMFDRYM